MRCSTRSAPPYRYRRWTGCGAIAAAAREWGDRWTEVARDCEVSDLGPAPEQKRKSRRTT